MLSEPSHSRTVACAALLAAAALSMAVFPVALTAVNA